MLIIGNNRTNNWGCTGSKLARYVWKCEFFFFFCVLKKLIYYRAMESRGEKDIRPSFSFGIAKQPGIPNITWKIDQRRNHPWVSGKGIFNLVFVLLLLKLAYIVFYWVNFVTIYFEKEDVSNNSPERLIFPKISQPKVLFFSLLFQSFQVSHVYSWFNIFRNFQIKNLWSRTGLCVNYLKKTYANPKTVLSWGKRKTCIFPMESV